MQTHRVDLAGRAVDLPVVRIADGLSIALLNLHGDVQLTEFCASALAPLIDADVLITAESKGLQLTHCVARLLGHARYAVARKTRKVYMGDVLSASVQSITTPGQQTLHLSGDDARLLQGRRVAIVDDVVSTGASIAAVSKLVSLAGGRLVGCFCVLAEGDARSMSNVRSLGTIPLFD